MKNLLLYGNPNVGKTSVFNGLTNSNSKVSNFDGATIEKKTAKSIDGQYMITDVPGTNSLSGSLDVEKVSYNALLDESVDVIIDVIDVTNIKRNLYLLIELLESGKHINVIANMGDVFNGTFDTQKFGNIFNVNVIIPNRQKDDIKSSELLNIKNNEFQINYGEHIEASIESLSGLLSDDLKYSNRFIAIQFLKGNEDTEKLFSNIQQAHIIKEELNKTIVDNNIAKSINGLFFVKRKDFIDQNLASFYVKGSSKNELKWMNEKFDYIALHKVYGYLLFALIMYLVFVITYQGGILQDVIDNFMSGFNQNIGDLLVNLNINENLINFIVNGALAGLTGVLVFIPQIIIMFTLLTILESIGYFSRVTVLFEHIFDKLGLSSHSMIPYISGLGCNVIGVMSTRTIKDEKKRIATVLTAPFISCSARLPIYIIFVDVFFKEHKSLILFFLYFLGIFVAIFSAFLIDKIFFKTENELTVFSLPTYKKVDTNYVIRSVKVKMQSYLNNAGKFILFGSMIIWILTNVGIHGFTTNLDESFLGLISSTISFIFIPLGFGTTEATASLLSGFLAKELAITTMLVTYNAESIKELSTVLMSHYDSASALSFMVFSLLYIPCLSTLGAIYSELKSIKYVFYAIALSLSMGYTFALIINLIF